uniref:Reverse transcriptase domain-containing protein n=1 Tax=Nicotiana tabacum TaxID=4097 RepID=A0A1S3XT66_TOBAC|nr:PREDICTED: uncharacterized protein LOC107768523 [Nicotiana tabacum]
MINGESTNPFKAARGMRQEDPIFPFLFAIAMEYLSRCLVGLKFDKDFKHHPKCVRLNVTYLCFTGDLLLFAKGLQANLRKSSVYFRGVTQCEKDSILQRLGYTNGELPFEYLWIPLSTKKLTLMQCQPLVEKIVTRISSWATKKLSYAGRCQLVQSVLFGIQAYWTQLFFLPTKVAKLIEGYCRSYLWSGTYTITKKALVAWSRVCTPKQCEFAQRVWSKLMMWAQRQDQTATRWDQYIHNIIARAKGKSQAAQIFKLLYAEFVHGIWIERNLRVFEKQNKVGRA